MTNLHTFKLDPVVKAFPNWNEFTESERIEIRQAWAKKDRNILVNKYGLDSDEELNNSNSRTSPR